MIDNRLQVFRAELEKNILSTVRRLRKNGVSRMSADNLAQLTPTPKTVVSLTPGGYLALFREVAFQVFPSFVSH